ncbi:MAG: 16S rRNA (adenine(1518)-N(6)/adenine(1519)-N(6))-dimethyltransferase RsmA [Lachnospiraceae bacterium]|nr:16S rRNA (adenine(1518)-N(6)/adenine(1519)-N(6))-dimethyltransferase RsmA [Lachnospiraceae bacterium]
MESKYIASPANTIEVLKKYSFVFQKRFGQNFLIDNFVLEKIIRAGQITKDDTVLEIGPGIGSLTQYLCENAGNVVAVEIDKALIPILQDTLSAYDNLTIINEDILKVDLAQLIITHAPKGRIKVVANLPYYITTPIIMNLLESGLPIDNITVMVQKEVALRMQAAHNTKDYGALSLAVQYYADVEYIANVPPNCFMPRPNVGSAVVTLTPRSAKSYGVKDEELLFKVTRAAFNQRRKTLVNALNNAANLSFTKEDIENVLKKQGLPATIRGEALSLEQFCVLSNHLHDLM